MFSKLVGIVFVVALAGASYALASGHGPVAYYSAEGAPPAADSVRTSAPDDAAIARDKQNSPLIQAQD
jgi:hypothetical protein